MLADVHFGAGSDVEIRHVLRIYGSATPHGELFGQPYVLHARASVDVLTGKVEESEFKPVTMEFVQDLATALGVHLPREVLPPGVLCRTHEVIAWWTPPAVQMLFYGGAKYPHLEKLNGEDLPLPALVWRLETGPGMLYVRALRGSDHPTPDALLCHAPLLNVEESGLVCQGSMRRPKAVSVHTLARWEEAVFGATQTSQLFGTAVAGPGGSGALADVLPSLRRRKRFPTDVLLAAGQTLTQFVQGVS